VQAFLQVVYAGVRDMDPAEQSFIAQNNIPLVTVQQMRATPNAVVHAMPASTEAVYIHLDLDVLDPESWPALQCPTPGGLLPEELAQVISTIHSHYKVVGTAITEFQAEIKYKASVLCPVLDALGLSHNINGCD